MLLCSPAYAFNNGFASALVGIDGLSGNSGDISSNAFAYTHDTALTYGATLKYFISHVGVGATITTAGFAGKTNLTTSIDHRINMLTGDIYLSLDDNINSGLPYGILFYGRLSDKASLNDISVTENFNVLGLGAGYLIGQSSSSFAYGMELRYIKTPSKMAAPDLVSLYVIAGYRF